MIGNKVDYSDEPVVLMTVEQDGQDALYYELPLPLLRAAMYAAKEELGRRTNAARDTTHLDWDQLTSDILLGCLQEYQQRIAIENRATKFLNWLEEMPPSTPGS